MITILKYLTILLTAIAGAFAILKDYKKPNSKYLSKTGIFLLSLIILSLLASIFLDYLSDRDSINKEESLRADSKLLKQKNDSLYKNLSETREALKEKIEQLETDNFQLSKELTKTSIQLNKNILGEGYALFEVYGSSKKGEYYSSIKSKTKYPIYDITLLVTDFDEAINCRTGMQGKKLMLDQDCFFKHSINVKSQTLTSGLVNYVEYNFKSDGEFKNLEIIFTSRNTHILQQAVYKLQKGFCQQSYRLYKIEGEKMTLFKADNTLNLPESYWTTKFYPINNRTLGIYKNP